MVQVRSTSDIREEFWGVFRHTIDQQIYVDLQEDYGFPRAVCRSLVELFHEYIDLYFGPQRAANQVVYHVAAAYVPPGVPTDEMRTVPVKLTIFDQEDVETVSRSGQKGLLHRRITRLTSEAYDQGGLLTQADLAILLGESPRTVLRAIKDIQNTGVFVHTRGNTRDIGPGISHKTRILDMYLKGMEYTDIERRTKHSGEAIMRYVKEFSRFVLLKEKGYGDDELRMITDQSEKLLREYSELYEKYSTQEYEERMSQIRFLGSKKTNTAPGTGKRAGPGGNG